MADRYRRVVSVRPACRNQTPQLAAGRKLRARFKLVVPEVLPVAATQNPVSCEWCFVDGNAVGRGEQPSRPRQAAFLRAFDLAPLPREDRSEAGRAPGPEWV